jgi:putative phosphoribosyl transferase
LAELQPRGFQAAEVVEPEGSCKNRSENIATNRAKDLGVLGGLIPGELALQVDCTPTVTEEDFNMAFRDRSEAGKLLAQQLLHYRDRSDVLVLALPRGGVPVAFEVAKILHAPLDIFLVRKLGLPGQEELAMGAVASGNVQVLNDDVVRPLGIPDELIQNVAERELRTLQRQEAVYRRGQPSQSVAGRTIILVDDGLATGTTMRAAIKALRQEQPKRLVVAVPIGAAETCREFRAEADEVVCAKAPEQFMAVGLWYQDFSPTQDDEVRRLLEEASHWQHACTT